ncbi:MAG: transposase [Syntrophales bacterium]
MNRKRFMAKQVIGFLREADVTLSKGRNMGQIWWKMGVTVQTYYRWRKEYGWMKTDQISGPALAQDQPRLLP